MLLQTHEQFSIEYTYREKTKIRIYFGIGSYTLEGAYVYGTNTTLGRVRVVTKKTEKPILCVTVYFRRGGDMPFRKQFVILTIHMLIFGGSTTALIRSVISEMWGLPLCPMNGDEGNSFSKK